MRYRAKVDANQPDIVEHFRRYGATVQHLHTIGNGCPDLLVGYRGATVPVEVKDGTLPASRQALTPDEALWMAQWVGSYRIVRSTADADELLRDIEQWTAGMPAHGAGGISPVGVGAVDARRGDAQAVAPNESQRRAAVVSEP